MSQSVHDLYELIAGILSPISAMVLDGCGRAKAGYELRQLREKGKRR